MPADSVAVVRSTRPLPLRRATAARTLLHPHLPAGRLESLGLRLVELKFRDVLAYPLTGGYSGPQMAPAFLLKGLLVLEKQLPQWLLKLLALRMVIVLERSGP